MSTIELIITCLGLSLDCFVVMMARGALVNQQEHRRSIANSLVFAVVSLMMLMIVLFVGTVIENQFVLHANQIGAALILFLLGCVLMIRAFRQNEFEERHDNNFSLKRVFWLGVVMSIDVFLLGTCVSMLQANMLEVCLVSTLLTLLSAQLGQEVGYRLGFAYRRVFFAAGSLILILMSLNVLSRIIPLLK